MSLCEDLRISNNDVMFVSSPSTNATLADVLQHVVIMSKGIVDDPRTTDNAWVERMALSLHANEDVYPPLRAESVLKWVTVSRELDMPPAQLDLVHDVSVAYGAYFTDKVWDLYTREEEKHPQRCNLSSALTARDREQTIRADELAPGCNVPYLVFALWLSLNIF